MYGPKQFQRRKYPTGTQSSYLFGRTTVRRLVEYGYDSPDTDQRGAG